MRLRNWGATPDEVSAQLPGDDICPDARIVATRSISLSASPEDVFPWLRQMGFGRAGWYSYDILDNLGRRSASSIVEKWQDLEEGGTMPGGPVDFRATTVQPPHTLVIMLDRRGRIGRRICFTLAYNLRPTASGTRLVTRARTRINLPGGVLLERFVLGPGDGVMVRKQLLGISHRIRLHD